MLTAVSVGLIVNVAIIARLVAVEIGRIPSTAILNVMNIFEVFLAPFSFAFLSFSDW